jgi:hypothetical protein
MRSTFYANVIIGACALSGSLSSPIAALASHTGPAPAEVRHDAPTVALLPPCRRHRHRPLNSRNGTPRPSTRSPIWPTSFASMRRPRAPCWPSARRHAIAFVPWGPIRSNETLDAAPVQQTATRHGANRAQVALAWVPTQGAYVPANPRDLLAENLADDGLPHHSHWLGPCPGHLRQTVMRRSSVPSRTPMW